MSWTRPGETARASARMPEASRTRSRSPSRAEPRASPCTVMTTPERARTASICCPPVTRYGGRTAGSRRTSPAGIRRCATMPQGAVRGREPAPDDPRTRPARRRPSMTDAARERAGRHRDRRPPVRPGRIAAYRGAVDPEGDEPATVRGRLRRGRSPPARAGHRHRRARRRPAGTPHARAIGAAVSCAGDSCAARPGTPGTPRHSPEAGHLDEAEQPREHAGEAEGAAEHTCETEGPDGRATGRQGDPKSGSQCGHRTIWLVTSAMSSLAWTAFALISYARSAAIISTISWTTSTLLDSRAPWITRPKPSSCAAP